MTRHYSDDARDIDADLSGFVARLERLRDAAPWWLRPPVSRAIADVERARAEVRRLTARAP